MVSEINYNNKTAILMELRLILKRVILAILIWYISLKHFLIYHIYHEWFKQIIYNNKMPTSAELIEILKDNEIRGYFHYTKSKLIDVLIEKGLIPKNMELVNTKKQRRI